MGELLLTIKLQCVADHTTIILNPDFIILLCLMPDDSTHQSESLHNLPLCLVNPLECKTPNDE